MVVMVTKTVAVARPTVSVGGSDVLALAPPPVIEVLNANAVRDSPVEVLTDALAATGEVETVHVLVCDTVPSCVADGETRRVTVAAVVCVTVTRDDADCDVVGVFAARVADSDGKRTVAVVGTEAERVTETVSTTFSVSEAAAVVVGVGRRVILGRAVSESVGWFDVDMVGVTRSASEAEEVSRSETEFDEEGTGPDGVVVLATVWVAVRDRVACSCENVIDFVPVGRSLVSVALCRVCCVTESRTASRVSVKPRRSVALNDAGKDRPDALDEFVERSEGLLVAEALPRDDVRDTASVSDAVDVRGLDADAVSDHSCDAVDVRERVALNSAVHDAETVLVLECALALPTTELLPLLVLERME